MPDAKIEIKLPELLAVGGDVPEENAPDAATGAIKPGQRKTTLAVYLKDNKAATGNQQRKFLATATWLQDGGLKRVATANVTKALSDNNQGKLTNPAQCLINLSKAGSVVREGSQFYVTDEGRAELAK